MEARADQEGLRGGALTTLEAMVVSMGFMAPSVAMFFNTPFKAMGQAFSEAGADEPDTTQEDVGRRKDRDAAEGQTRRETPE